MLLSVLPTRKQYNNKPNPGLTIYVS